MTLRQLSNYADILGALTVVGGVVFGLIQLSEYRKQRRDSIAAELMRTFYNVDFADAVALVRTLPDHCPASDLRQRGPQYERAAVIIGKSLETMGLLVFRRIADYELVVRLAEQAATRKDEAHPAYVAHKGWEP